MASLTILTLFLGLTTGSQTVALSVEGPVARVEVRLDGEVCGERQRPPWLFRCDFGEELAPHRLEAVAYDDEGRVLARTDSHANLQPRQAEAEMVVERDDGGRAEALRVVWDAVTAPTPTSLLVSFDDVPLELPEGKMPSSGSLRLPLPDHDPRRIHFASAELTFPDGTAARADVAFGGALSDEVSSQSTGVPLLPARDPADGRALTPATAAGNLAAVRPGGGATELRALAMEGGEADLVAVVEASAAAELAALRRRFEVDGSGAREGQAAAGLASGDRFTLIDPVPRSAPQPLVAGESYDVFQASPPRFASQGGLVWQLTHVFYPPGERQHLADAVAMAGMQAAAGSRPRAVLLVLGPEARDDSRFTPAQVRRYLDRLRVPLAVWWLEREGRELDRRERRQAALDRDQRRMRKGAFAAAWGGVEEVTGFRDLVGAAQRLRQRVGEQRVLWVDGLHLPTEITAAASPSGTGNGVRLLGVDAVRGERVKTAEEIALPGGDTLPRELLAESGQAPAADRLETGTDTGAGHGEGATLPAAARGAGDTAPAAQAADAAGPGGPLLLEGAGLETFRDSLRVDLVEVEAVVTDRQGRPLSDLGPEDFEVLDDGEPVEVRHFALVDPQTPTPETPSPGATSEPRAVPAATAPAPAATPPTLQPVHMAIYLDEENMQAKERNRMLGRLEPLLSALPAGARIQVVAQQGGLRTLQPFTRDRQAVRDALLGATGGSGGARQRDQERWRALDQVMAADSLEDALRVADLYASQRMLEVKTTLGHLGAMVDALAPLPGRKAVVYLGSGLQILPGREAFQVRDPGPNFGRSGHPALRAAEWDATPLYKALARKASAARVAFYGIDAGGLRGAAAFDVERREHSPGLQLDSDIAENVARPLQLMAQATGGLAITGTNRIEPEIERVAGDFSRYYVLGFSPAEEAGGDRGAAREIEVRVDRPGARVRHRSAYLLQDPDRRMTDAVTAALTLAPDTESPGDGGPGLALDFGTPLRLDDGSFRVPVEVRIPFSGMVLVPSGSRWVNDLEVFVAVASPDGATSPVRRAPVSIDLSSAAARAARGDYTVTLPLRMAAGEHRVAVGVRDAVTGAETVTAADTDVEAPASPLQIWVAERRQGGDGAEAVAGAVLLSATSSADRKMLARNGATGSRLVPTADHHPFGGPLSVSLLDRLSAGSQAEGGGEGERAP